VACFFESHPTNCNPSFGPCPPKPLNLTFMKHAIKQCSHTIESKSVMAYYNENDPFAAAWLRELIKAGHICQGEVDERDVRDVLASDLRGFTQHHFFAGIGGWSRALRLAGWPDDRRVWTGSCPCQPYSTAGKRKGPADDRNLWWAFFHLIRECKPDIIFGEQVEEAVSHKWIDVVSSDLEAEGYACGTAVLGAHSVSAPHIRQRLFFVGHAEHNGPQGQPQLGGTQEGRRLRELEGSGDFAGKPGNANCERREGLAGVADDTRPTEEPSPVGGFWADAKWLCCRDEKNRATKPDLQPLAYGVRNRVGLLRGAGNAIVPQAAEAFIRACLTPDEKPLSVLSTLLYPGRKQWFVPRAADFFRVNPCQTLIEPFAGSGVVGLSLLDAEVIDRLVLVEKDPRIVCLLKGLLEDPDLADRYAAFRCTRANVEALMESEKGAFRWLVQTRCSNRGRFSGGLRTRIDSRWCRNFVVANIRRVYAMGGRVEVIEGDGLEVMRQYSDDPNVGCFADPPYTADAASNGHHLYRYHKLNHQKLFSMLARWRGPWLLTEDYSRMVRRLALCYRLASEQILMTTADNTKKKELVLWRERRIF